jgi:hypothetical protein
MISMCCRSLNSDTLGEDGEQTWKLSRSRTCSVKLMTQVGRDIASHIRSIGILLGSIFPGWRRLKIKVDDIKCYERDDVTRK